MILKGTHVFLRPLEETDLDALYTLLNQESLLGRRYLPGETPDDTLLSSGTVRLVYEDWAKMDRGFNLGVFRDETGDLVGHAGADWGWDAHGANVHVVLHPTYWRRAYGSQCIYMLMEYLYGYTVVHNVAVTFESWNEIAAGFCEKHGFKDAGRFRRTGVRGGAFHDMVCMDMLRSEWIAHRGGQLYAT